MKKHSVLNPLFLAVSMLTRINVVPGRLVDSDWKWCAALFPGCGVILGTVCMLPWSVLIILKHLAVKNSIPYFDLPYYSINILGSLLFVAGLAWMTRIFHLDGFCDTCDAFSAVTDSREKRLEIMKDPHPGAAAIFASVILIIGKVIVVFLLLEKCGMEITTRRVLYKGIAVLVLIPTVARFSMLLLANIGSYAREKGTGAKIINETIPFSIVVGLIIIIPFLVFIKPIPMIIVLLGMVATAFYWKVKATPLLGGITGDVLGACVETAEVVAGILLLVLF